ncbi:MAG: hypothetical protein IKI95_08995 [Clostridia bacterium]|nr:hypothetical protein [Clostridia bacterium]
MRLKTKIKLFFSKKLRNELSCVGCELPCAGEYNIRKSKICDIMVRNYERKGK